MKGNLGQYAIDCKKAIESLADQMMMELDRIIEKKNDRKIKVVECHKGSYSRN